MSSIDKPKGEKYWKITFYIDGKRYRRSLKVTTKKHAQTLKQELDFLLARNLVDPDDLFAKQTPTLSLYTAIDQYLDYINKRKDLTPVTKNDYDYSLGTILKSFMPDQSVNDIKPATIEFELLPSMEERFGSINTVRHHMLAMSAFFGYLVRQDPQPITVNPFRGKVPVAPKKEPVWLPTEHVKVLLEYFRNEKKPAWQRLYFPLMLNTGLRVTPMRLLDWEKNIFLQERYLRFPAKGKYAGKWRTVPLNDFSIQMLMNHPRKDGETKVFHEVKSRSTVDTAWIRF